MKLLFDFLPVLAFFVVYKLAGIYFATSAAIALSVVQTLAYWLKHRRVPELQLFSLAIIVIFGGATLLLHNELIIKWKPTVLYWCLAALFVGSQLIGKTPFVQRFLSTSITLSAQSWARLNASWAIFFSALGGLNLYVAYRYPTDVWVNFKLFGLLGLTTLFIVGQAIYLATQLQPDAPN